MAPLMPVVRFGPEDSDVIAIPPWSFSVGGDSPTNYFSIGAICLPLSLAYAFTVHKVQGLTLLGRVHINLEGMWACPHLMYVAMSRVRNPAQLTIAGFDEEHVKADPEAVSFDEALKVPKETKITAETVRGSWISGELKPKRKRDISRLVRSSVRQMKEQDSLRTAQRNLELQLPQAKQPVEEQL